MSYIEWNLGYLPPVFDDHQNVIDWWTVLRIRSQHMSYQIIHFVAVAIFPICWYLEDCTWNCQLVSLQEWVDEVTESIQDASKHPYVDFFRDSISQEWISNLRWSVHGCRIFLQIIFVECKIRLVDGGEICNFVSAWTKITEFVVIIFS